jgi:hypothetical protein
LVRDAGPPKKATFAVLERTFTKAAGVSPPWDRKPHLQWRSVFVE